MTEETLEEWFYNNKVPIMIDLASGSFSGMYFNNLLRNSCNCLSSHPMDTVKVRMQMSDNSMINTIKGIFLKEGFFGYYKGMQFPLLAVPLINSCVFTVYEYCRRIFKGSS